MTQTLELTHKSGPTMGTDPQSLAMIRLAAQKLNEGAPGMHDVALTNLRTFALHKAVEVNGDVAPVAASHETVDHGSQQLPQ